MQRSVAQSFKVKLHMIKEYESIIITANELGASHSNICAVLKGRRNKCKGFKFKYKI